MNPHNKEVAFRERYAQKTNETIRRIAELRIEALGLSDTVEEYIEKCTKTKR